MGVELLLGGVGLGVGPQEGEPLAHERCLVQGGRLKAHGDEGGRFSRPMTTRSFKSWIMSASQPFSYFASMAYSNSVFIHREVGISLLVSSRLLISLA